MAIFFVRLTDSEHGARSIAFSCRHHDVAAATRALHRDDYLSGHRCEWRWNEDRTRREIISRTGLTLSAERISAIEEPHVHFVGEMAALDEDDEDDDR
jgi:hypothetical protein